MELQELITKWQERKKKVLSDYLEDGEEWKSVNAAINFEVSIFLQDLKLLELQSPSPSNQ